MSLRIDSLDDGLVIVVKGKDSVKYFKELVQRATNLWPDAPSEIKHFADQVTNPDLLACMPSGRLQDYEAHEVKRVGVTCGECHTVNLIDVTKGTKQARWKCTHCLASNLTEIAK